MSLIDAVSEIGSGLANAAIVAALNATVVLATNSERVTWTGVSDVLIELGLTPQQIDAFIASVPSLPGGVALDKALSSGGADFSHASVQAGIDAAVSAGLNAGIGAALKAIGVTRGKRYTQFGLAALPSEADVAAAKTQVIAREWANGMWAGIVQPALSEGKTKDELKALIANS